LIFNSQSKLHSCADPWTEGFLKCYFFSLLTATCNLVSAGFRISWWL